MRTRKLTASLALAFLITLCGLLMPPSARQAYFALRAFNVEIASIKDASRLMGRSRAELENNAEGINNTNDASLASRLRMQWWKDGVAEVYENRRNANTNSHEAKFASDPLLRSLTSSRQQNPTMRSLSHAIHNHDLTHRFLRRMMEAREEDLAVSQYDRCTDVAQYGEDTVSSFLYLSLECVGVRDEASDLVASDIGVSLGLINALRSTAFRAMQGECSIPLDLTTKYSITMDTIWDAANAHNNEAVKEAKFVEAQESLQNAAQEMAEMASLHLHRARAKQSVVPKEARACLLPAVCGLRYLNDLKECNYDLFHPSLADGRRLRLMLLLGRAWLTGSY
ncbi:LOW QUALITY PROTEIN: hypothetical protein HJC23_006251 [Cyclotella cryptica]|uniref:Phytoene synthase n=1 Tax=Cyclotella cryptica TaxID=29204 RepID=A0ABD3PL05_9STRA